jgi:hypothetical protein
MALISKEDIARWVTSLPQVDGYQWSAEIGITEQEMVVPLVGPAYWQQLKTEQANAQFTEPSLELMQFLTPAMAFYTAYLALPSLLLLQPEAERWNAKIAQERRNHYLSRARLYAQQVLQLVGEKPEDYPLVNPITALLPKNFPVFIPN